MLPTSTLQDIIRIHTDTVRLGLDLAGVMQLVVERTIDLVSADGAVIELAEGDEMVYRAAAGTATDSLGLRLRLKDSLSGLCVQLGQACLCEDAETDERVDREACRRVGVRSMIVIPLRHEDATVGVLKAISIHPAHFSDDDVTALGLLSGLIAAAMFYASKYDMDALFHKATHDSMTTLANRSLFMERLHNRVAQGARDGSTTGILIIDMDGFKQINDNFGHRVGDAVLVEFAARLKDALRQSDTVARLGGDEFGVLLVAAEGEPQIEFARKRLQVRLQEPFDFEGRQLALQASVGSALFPTEARDVESLLDLADHRMYLAKQAKRRPRDPQADMQQVA